MGKLGVQLKNDLINLLLGRFTDNKFGVPLKTQGEAAIRKLMEAPALDLAGLHVHLGSPIFEREPFAKAVDVVFEFAAQMKRDHGFEMQEFSPGGGFAVDYTLDQHAPSPADYAETIVPAIKAACEKHDLPQPHIFIEPGRSIVARAGVALYTVGSSKDVPGVRRYVSVDGGMADNIRPPLYDSRYEALVAGIARMIHRDPLRDTGRISFPSDRSQRTITPTGSPLASV